MLQALITALTRVLKVIHCKEDPATANKVSCCHPFRERLRKPRLNVACFALGGYTNQASFLAEISVLHYRATFPANLK